jgi:hypothetical protein
MKKGRNVWLTAGLVLFTVYFFAAARPVPPETVLVNRWLRSLETESPVIDAGAAQEHDALKLNELMPFELGERFGYVDTDGRFTINRIKKENLYLCETGWSEYADVPDTIEIRDTSGTARLTLARPFGYPVLLDDRIFLLGAEQNSLSELDTTGQIVWTYEFGAQITCIDAAAGLVLAGALDGAVEVLDRTGKRVFFFEPGGSRYPVIAGCAMSRNGSMFGIVSGVDDQRFLLLERFGGAFGEYKVIYHEFLEDGFRRPVHVAFIDQDRRIIFEREGGLGIYEIGARQSRKIFLEGSIAAIDHSGGDGIFFVVSSLLEDQKKLSGIRLPGTIFLEAPFKSGDVFLGRRGALLFAGGGGTLASFSLEKK